jgi:predicted HAD superfamily Cof-like phosphohydrolase
MKDNIEKVAHFHEVFKIGNNTKPTPISQSEFELRFNLLKEENEEYLEACKNQDIVEIADALGDILYITFGTIMRHGLQNKIQEVFDEIQRSNMSKLDDEGLPIFREDGKILKSKNYFKPNIKAILDKE